MVCDNKTVERAEKDRSYEYFGTSARGVSKKYAYLGFARRAEPERWIEDREARGQRPRLQQGMGMGWMGV
jgi:hypothetical protein